MVSAERANLPGGMSAVLDPVGWQQMLADAATPVVVEAPRAFTARARMVKNNEIGLGRVIATRNDTYGLVAAPSKRRGNVLVFNLVVKGRGWIIQDNRTASFDSGDFVVYSSGRPHEWHFASDHEIVGIVVPIARMGTYARYVDMLTATRAPAEDPVVSAVGTSVECFERNIAAAGVYNQTRFLEQIVHGIETLSRHLAIEFKLIESRRAAFLESVEEVIQRNLADPDLSPAMIASHLSVSVRTLYAMFDNTEASVSATIRRLRLERCAADLLDLTQSHQSVSLIGARWGFASPSHFSAVFRRNYGMAPTDYRRFRGGLDESMLVRQNSPGSSTVAIVDTSSGSHRRCTRDHAAWPEAR